MSRTPPEQADTPGRAPEYEDFFRAVEILRELERKGLVDIVYGPRRPDQAIPPLILQIDPKASTLPPVVEFRGILSLDPSKTSYPIAYAQVQDVKPEAEQAIRVDTRSLLGIMYYLSEAVEAPAIDLQRGRVTVTRTESGETFDWQALLGGLFKIKTATSRPADAVIAVRYRGNWFYVDDADLGSKSTFVMLSQIFSLQAGKAEGIPPVLTLPLEDNRDFA